MKNTKKLISILVLLAGSGSVIAQNTAAPIPYPLLQNVAQLSASGSVEVQQDLLTISLTTSRDGSDASVVQSQLKAALESALAEAKKQAQPGLMDLRTGNFSLYPRYGKDGKINGWQGSTELVLEGRDFPRITATAGKIQTLTMGYVSFNLSREQRAKVEGEAQTLAIERFKAKAENVARSFGFSSFTLREVAVHANDQSDTPRPRQMAMEARASAADAPIPLEAGKSTVLVSVAGSVQMK